MGDETEVQVGRTPERDEQARALWRRTRWAMAEDPSVGGVTLLSPSGAGRLLGGEPVRTARRVADAVFALVLLLGYATIGRAVTSGSAGQPDRRSGPCTRRSSGRVVSYAVLEGRTGASRHPGARHWVDDSRAPVRHLGAEPQSSCRQDLRQAPHESPPAGAVLDRCCTAGARVHLAQGPGRYSGTSCWPGSTRLPTAPAMTTSVSAGQDRCGGPART